MSAHTTVTITRERAERMLTKNFGKIDKEDNSELVEVFRRLKHAEALFQAEISLISDEDLEDILDCALYDTLENFAISG